MLPDPHGEGRSPHVAAKRAIGAALVVAFLCAALATWWLAFRPSAEHGDPAAVSTASAAPRSAEFRKLVATEPVPVVKPLVAAALPPDRARAINAAVPFADGPVPAAKPYVARLGEPDFERATDCLTAAMWYEAGVDWEGQKAVAQVVLNRVRHPAFPHSVCAVVFQGSERTTGCQFTFTCDGAMARVPPAAAWSRTRAQAVRALRGATYSAVGLATHYHTDWVVPYWSGELDKIAAVRSHLFFRWKGGWGRPVAFVSRPASGEPLVQALAALSSAHRAAASPEVSISAAQAMADDAPPAIAPPVRAVPAGDRAVVDSLPGKRGAHVLLVHPEGDAFVLLFDANVLPGTYALAALDLCKGKPFCKVMGWRDAGDAPRAFPIGADADRSMSYVYLFQNGQEYMRWNCDQVPDPPGNQCRGVGGVGWDRASTPAKAPVKSAG